MVTALAQGADDEEFGRHATGGRDRTDATFEAGEALLERRDRWIADAGVDVAVLLQREEIGGVGGVLEDETGGLEDRDRSCPRGRLGVGAGVDRPGAKRPLVLAACHLVTCGDCRAWS